MAFKPVPLPTGAYADDSKPFSDQDVVNLWCEYAEGEGTRSPAKLVQLPGLRPFADFGPGPHRGIRNVEGNLYVVADTHAYQVAVDGTATILGTIPGRGRVWIAHNQNNSGAVRQVMFSNGPEGFIWDVAAETWTQISDDAFHGARSLIYLNSRFLGIEQQRRYFANSALADGLNWDSIETYQAESAPDRLVALIPFAGEVYAFNERTLEAFQNTTSDADIANHIYFTRIASPIPVGAASAHGVCELDSRIFFIGNNGAGYYLSGYNPVRVTTPAIEKAWQDCDLSKAFCFTYESRGHAIWYVTFPDGHTWGYDCLSSARAGRPIWHRRETIGLDRWRLNTLAQWNDGWYGGAYNSGILYQLDWDYHGLEGCDEIDRYFIPGVLHNEGNRVTLNALRLECDTGYGTSECESVDPQSPLNLDDLFDALECWWPFDGDLTNATGAGDFGGSGTPLYQAGLQGQECKPGSRISAWNSTAHAPIAGDVALCFGLHLTGASSSNRLLVGFSGSGVGLTTRAGVAVEDSGTSITGYVDDASDTDEPFVTKSGLVVGTRHFVYIELDWAAKTLTMYVDNVLIGTTTPVTAWWLDMLEIQARANNGVDATAPPDYVDEMATWNRKLTSAERTWLYNHGALRSYAELAP